MRKRTLIFEFSYSGADVAVVCREALLRPIRRLSSATHFKQVNIHQIFCLSIIVTTSIQVPNQNKGPNEPTHVWLACSPGDPGATEMTLDKINPDDICEPPVTMVSNYLNV